MRQHSTNLSSAFALLAVCMLGSGVLALEPEEAKFAFHIGPTPASEGIVIYDNESSPANLAFSSTDLGATFGDTASMTGTGLLREFTFSVFNSTNGGANMSPILTADATIEFYDDIDGGSGLPTSLIGSFTTSIDFGPGGLAPGFFSTITVTSLEPASITFGDPDIVITQSLSNITGGSNRAGIASAIPVTIGSSDPTMYIDATTVGPAGFYTIGSPPVPADVIYTVDVVPEPAALGLLMVGGLLSLGIRRRRV